MDDLECPIGERLLCKPLLWRVLVFDHERLDVLDGHECEPHKHALDVGIGHPKEVLVDLVWERAVCAEPDGAVGCLAELGAVAAGKERPGQRERLAL